MEAATYKFSQEVPLHELIRALQTNCTFVKTSSQGSVSLDYECLGLHCQIRSFPGQDDVMKQKIKMEVYSSQHLIEVNEIRDCDYQVSRALLQAMMSNTMVRKFTLAVDVLEMPHLTAIVDGLQDNLALRFLKIGAWNENRCSEDAIRMAFEKIMEKNMSLRKI